MCRKAIRRTTANRGVFRQSPSRLAIWVVDAHLNEHMRAFDFARRPPLPKALLFAMIARLGKTKGGPSFYPRPRSLPLSPDLLRLSGAATTKKKVVFAPIY